MFTNKDFLFSRVSMDNSLVVEDPKSGISYLTVKKTTPRIEVKKWYVYIILFDDDVIKIGVSITPVKRIQHHSVNTIRNVKEQFISPIMFSKKAFYIESLIKKTYKHLTFAVNPEFFRGGDYNVVKKIVQKELDDELDRLT